MSPDAAAVTVAIEGPCCAGKTTLAQALRAAIPSVPSTIITDYADFVGGACGMPDPDPSSLPAELDALQELLRIESARFSSALPALQSARMILIDRSSHTLSWHCAGTDRAHRREAPFQGHVDSVLAADERPRWPELVIYLDVSAATQLERNKGKFLPRSIFMDPGYNRGFREGYERFADARAVPCARIDADGSPESVLQGAMRFLSAHIPALGEAP